MNTNFKKNAISRLIISLLTAGAMLCMMAFSFVGCSKEVKTSADFKTTFEASEYTVSEFDTADSSYSLAKSALIASKKKLPASVYYFECETDDDAIELYDIIYEESIGGNPEESGSVVAGDNFKKYTLATEDDFSLLSRVGSTIVLMSCDASVKDEIKGMAEKIGY